ncbi:hypothetical protein [Acidisoma cladoniae]|jgi:hypothetical protein|uniref:hypothetical protein n=1 Tax=Acidisoma cladoniae TaxID=3040935 RepID=UPI00254C38B3|nr:hypothetical protein [Acidisoma sp. PAMC 29798]
MSDLNHTFDGDLSVSAGGDLALASGSLLGQQRVLRRLLTNPGDYIWHLSYGAGLPAQIGTPASAATIRGVVRNQIFNEPLVAADPAPVITVQTTDNYVSLQISYSDAVATQTQTLAITLTA